MTLLTLAGIGLSARAVMPSLFQSIVSVFLLPAPQEPILGVAWLGVIRAGLLIPGFDLAAISGRLNLRF